MKINKRMVRVIALALVQFLILMNFSWVDGFEFTGRLEYEQAAALSPHIYIQEDFFQKAYDVFCNTASGEEGHEKYPRINKELELKRNLLKWEKYGLAEFYSAVESGDIDAIKIAGIKLNPEWCYGVGLYSLLVGWIGFPLIGLSKSGVFFAVFSVFAVISMGSMLAGLSVRLLILSIMKYYKYRAERLLSMAYKEAEENKDFKKAEKYYAGLLEKKKTVEKLLDISIITGTEEKLREEDKRRFEFINIIEGIIEPEESSLRNKGRYEKADEKKFLRFPAGYLWEDINVPWKKFLKMPPEEMISAGTEISKTQTDYLEELKELIYGIKKGYVMLNCSDNMGLNSYVLEKLLKLGQELDWRNPLELLEFDMRYMQLKEKNNIISYGELRRYYAQMFSRRDELVGMLIEQAI